MVAPSLARAGPALRRRTRLVVAVWAATLAVLVVVFTVAAPRATTDAAAQLIANNSFERGLAPWEETGDAVAERSIETALVGHASARAEALEEDSAFGIKYLSALFGPKRGDRYVATAWVKGIRDAVGRRVVLEVVERGEGTFPRKQYVGIGRVARSWRPVQVVVPITRDDVHDLSLFVYVDDADEPRDAIFVDQVSLVRIASGDEDER